MAVNLPPQYHAAEEKAKKAKTPEERLAAYREMWVILPKHKASEKVQAILKTKISELVDEIDAAKSATKRSAPGSYKIPRQGAGTIVFLGPPNCGKSTLLAKLTRATPAIAPYPFTTREPIPGMLDVEDVRIQLVDLPPITAEAYEPFITDLTRGANAAVLFLDLADDDGPSATQAVIDRLRSARRLLVRPGDASDDDPANYSLPTLLLATKADDEAAEVRLEIAREVFGDRLSWQIISAENGTGLNELKSILFQMLGVVRIYSKQPGKPADMNAPFTVPIGATVSDLAGCIHKDLEEKVKSARIWGSASFEGQTVGRDYILADRDVVELQVI